MIDAGETAQGAPVIRAFSDVEALEAAGFDRALSAPFDGPSLVRLARDSELAGLVLNPAGPVATIIPPESLHTLVPGEGPVEPLGEGRSRGAGRLRRTVDDGRRALAGAREREDHARVVQLGDAALAATRELGDLQHTAELLCDVAEASLQLDRPAEALRLAEEGAALAGALGDRRRAVVAHCLRASALTGDGRLDEAEQALGQGRARAANVPDQRRCALLYALLASARLADGDAPAARRSARDCLELCLTIADEDGTAHAQALLRRADAVSSSSEGSAP